MIKRLEGREYLSEYCLGTNVHFAYNSNFKDGSPSRRQVFSLLEIHSVLVKHIHSVSMLLMNRNGEGYSPVGEVVGIILKKPNTRQGVETFFGPEGQYTGLSLWAGNINWAKETIVNYCKNSNDPLRRENILQELERWTAGHGHGLLAKFYPIIRGSVSPTLGLVGCENVRDVWLRFRETLPLVQDFHTQTLPAIRDCFDLVKVEEELDI